MQKKYLIVLIVAVLLVSLFVGYAAGRGYKTYEVNLENKAVQRQSSGFLASDPDSKVLDKELVSPYVYAPKFVKVEALKDTQSGYNLKIETANFAFRPENFGKDLAQNTGYANVYVNNQKVGRAYGNWFHVPETFFQSGTNTISVTLNAHNYKTWWSKKGTLEARYNLDVVGK